MIEEALEVKELLEELDKRFYMSTIKKLEYLLNHLGIEELRRISQIKTRFPDGTVIGVWWRHTIHNLHQKSKVILWNELTKEEQDALYILAQIDDIRDDILDLAGRLLYIKNHLIGKELRGITQVKKRFPDGTIIGQWWNSALRKRLNKIIQKDVNELTEEERYILTITRDILMIYQDIALDDSVKLALLKRNQK